MRAPLLDKRIMMSFMEPMRWRLPFRLTSSAVGPGKWGTQRGAGRGGGSRLSLEASAPAATASAPALKPSQKLPSSCLEACTCSGGSEAGRGTWCCWPEGSCSDGERGRGSALVIGEAGGGDVELESELMEGQAGGMMFFMLILITSPGAEMLKPLSTNTAASTARRRCACETCTVISRTGKCRA